LNVYSKCALKKWADAEGIVHIKKESFSAATRVVTNTLETLLLFSRADPQERWLFYKTKASYKTGNSKLG
jgi:hypothetical protein